MFNSFNSADRFDESQNNQSESINLDEEVSLLDEKANQHTQEMSAMTQDANVDKESEMYLLMRQLNGEPENVQKNIEFTAYSPANILSQLSDLSQKSWFTNMEHTRSLKDTTWNILSIETKGKNMQQESVWSCFYKSCKCPKFSSKGNYMINEYYDENGNVDRADAPVEYQQAA
jgi:hypothetical protein